jgi:predicted  nucleic acid-binding Zn-ribbon protein
MSDILTKDFERLEQDVRDLETQLYQSEITLQRNEERIETLAKESGKKEERIRALELDVAARERETVTLRQTHQELESRIEELETEAKQRDTKIIELEGSLTTKDDELATLHEELTSASERVAELSKERGELEKALRQGREKAETTTVQALQNQMRKARRQFRVLTTLPLVFGGVLGLVGAILGLALGAGIGIATGGLGFGISATLIPLVFLLIAASFGFLLGYFIAWLVILVMRVFGG